MAGSNWMLYRTKQPPGLVASREPMTGFYEAPFGSSAAASFEINTVRDSTDFSNSIFRLSATALMIPEGSLTSNQGNRSPGPNLGSVEEEEDDDFVAKVEMTEDEGDEGEVQRVTGRFAASLDLSDESDASTPRQEDRTPSPKRRKAPHAPLSVTDPFNPEVGARDGTPCVTDRIAERSTLLSSPYVYRDGSPEARKLTYKVVKGPAPPPPSAPVEQTVAEDRVVYRRHDKRPAPQPPSVYEHDFWEAVEAEARRPLSSTRGVEAKVRQKQSKEERKRMSVRSDTSPYNGEISLTFREKMFRFFGLTGRHRVRSRASFTLSSPSNNNVKFFSTRNSPHQTLQSFSYLHSKSYVMQNGSEEPMREHELDISRSVTPVSSTSIRSVDPPVHRAWTKSNASSRSYNPARNTRRSYSDMQHSREMRY